MTNINAPHIDRSGRVDPRPKRHTPVEFLTSGHPMPTEMHRPSIAALDEAAKRTRRPCRRWDMTWKPDFTGEGEPVMNFSWFVWDRAAANDGISCTANLLTRDGPADA